MEAEAYVDGKHVGFRTDNGRLFLLRCPKCDLENWAMAVADSVCAWCGWKEPAPQVGEKEAGDE